MSIRRLPSQESGSALILALVFLSMFGLFIASLLSFADTSFRGTLAVRDQGSVAYGVDGAVEGAINYVRYSYPDGKDPAQGGSCNTFAPPATNGVTVTVQCMGQTGSGESTGANPNSKPKQAILTLATGGEVGIAQTKNNALNIHGGIFSNSTITSSGGSSGSLAIDGDVSATGACTGTITSTYPPLHCSNTGGGANGSEGLDPNYSAAISTAPPLNTSLPSCGSSWLVQFTPNQTYDDAVGLTNMMSGGGGCAGKVMYFPAGNYYFDFRRPAASHVWTLNDSNLNLIGGTPRGWSTAAASKPGVITTGATGLCKTDKDPTPNNGVQFIFGGDSQLNVNNATFELCAQPSTSAQQIAIFGLKTGAGGSASASLSPGNATGTPTRFLTKTYPGGATPSPAKPTGYGAFAQSDGYVELAALDGNNASETLSGYGTVPSDALVTGAILHIVHQESNVKTADYATGPAATITPGTGASFSCGSVTLSSVGLVDDTSCNLFSKGMITPAAFNGMTLRYDVDMKSKQQSTVQLDAAYVVVSYIPVTLETQSGCVVLTPYPTVGCPFIKTGGSQTTFVLQGTVYAPKAALDIALTNVSTQIFGRGVVARTLQLSITPSTSYSGPTVNVPDDAVPTDRTVVFVAYVNGVARLRATVTYNDNAGATPGQAVHVTSWSVIR